MEQIVLLLYGIELGVLYEKNNEIIFEANEEGIIKAALNNPLQMRLFSLNRSGKKPYKNLPYPFNEFLGYTFRSDLKEKANINDEDSDFVRVYKLSHLDMSTPIFSIANK